MAKRCETAVLDAALSEIRTNATRMTICSAEPTTYAQVATYRLGEVTVDTSDFTIGAGTGTGRRLTTTLQANVPLTATGNGNHVALHNNSSRLLYVTTCPLQSLTSGGTVNIPSWIIELAGPV